MRALYARARANAALTPGERALLKLIEGLLCAGLVAGLPIIAGALGHAGVQWTEVGRTALAAGSVAALLALAKYLKAHGDPALGDTLTALAGEITSPPAPLLAMRGGPEKESAAGISDAVAGDGSDPARAAAPDLPAHPDSPAADEASRSA